MVQTLKYLFTKDENYGSLGLILALEKIGFLNREKLFRIKKSIFRDRFNMHTDAAEKYYRQVYLHYLEDFLHGRKEILEIGCQFGRFTFDLLKRGHTVTATDIEQRYGDYIYSKLPATENFSFRLEDISRTVRNTQAHQFDIVTCIEVLALIRDHEDALWRMKKLIKPGGILIATHRTPTYYIYHFLKKKRPDMAEKVLKKEFTKFNYQDKKELEQLYAKLGYKLELVKGIGLLSGRRNDALGLLTDPAKLSDHDREVLFRMETDPELQEKLLEQSRYLLVVATPY